jgi:peptide-methionine (S)-S-oxide reductase
MTRVLLLTATAALLAGSSGLARSERTIVASAPVPAATATFATQSSAPDTAVFAGGCFWGIEGVFDHVKGVTAATSGYAGGSVAAPGYEQVSTGGTGHAESVQVVYDPSRISYGQLLQLFFSIHDPTLLNRQGPDVGTQYRSAIFYRNDSQKRAAEAYVAQLRAAKTFARPIVTQIAPLHGFYPAEAYHQNYMAQHPNAMYIVVNDAPKLDLLRRNFPALYRQ